MISQSRYTALRSLLPGSIMMMLVLLLLAACGTQSAENQPAASEPSQSEAKQSAVHEDSPASSETGAEAARSEGPLIAVDSTLIEKTDLDIGQVAPDFAYTLADGTTYQLSDLRGNKVLINFWGIGCPPCQHEMPDIQQASVRFKDDGLVVLAVNGWQQQPEAIELFAQDLGLTFNLIANTDGDIGSAYDVPGLPASFFINTDGTLHFKKVGVIDTELIASQLEEMY